MIKKILFGFALLAAAVSCSDDNFDWGTQPQHNDQPEIVNFGDGSVTAAAPIDFADLAEGQTMVKVCDIVAPTASNEAYNVATNVLKLENGDCKLTSEGEVTVDFLKSYLENNYGKAPVERELKATVEQWISNGATAVKTATSDTFVIKAKLVAPYISEHYYVIGQPSEWTPGCTTLPFKHSNANVYDDPVFTVTFPVAAGETWFAITDDVTLEHAPEGDAAWAYVLGCAEGNGNNGMEGNIMRRNELPDEGSWKIVADKDCSVRMTINMMDYTYKLEIFSFNEYVGVIGNHNGWGADEPIASPNMDGKYQGYLYLNGGFKIRQNGSWADADTWGTNGNPGELTQPGSDIWADEGFYQINADLAANTYSLVPVTSITCVGNHNGWNQADEACHMTYNVEEKCWEGTFALTNGFKFAMNDDWSISWGGVNGDPSSYDLLTEYNGKDLDAPEGDGTYAIKLYLSCEGKHKVVLTKQ